MVPFCFLILKGQLNGIKNGGNKSVSPKKILNNPFKFWKVRDHVIQFVIDYTTLASDAKFRATQRRRIDILPLKQLLQSFPILLLQAEADNTSENLLNGIRQIVY